MDKQTETAPAEGGGPPPRHFGMRIARDGAWHYRGSPIRRLPLVRLFASVLRREADGRYWLVTPVERGVIDVDDAPFLAVELEHRAGANPEGRDDALAFRTNLDEEVVCGPDRPLRVEIDPDTEEPSPYIRVRDGLDARLTRAVFLELADLAREREVDGEKVLGIWSEGAFFVLGPAVPDC